MDKGFDMDTGVAHYWRLGKGLKHMYKFLLYWPTDLVKPIPKGVQTVWTAQLQQEVSKLLKTFTTLHCTNIHRANIFTACKFSSHTNDKWPNLDNPHSLHTDNCFMSQYLTIQFGFQKFVTRHFFKLHTKPLQVRTSHNSKFKIFP